MAFLETGKRTSRGRRKAKTYSADWHSLLPPKVAENQIRWEAAHRIVRAVEAGAKFVDIARMQGVSPQAIQQTYHRTITAKKSGFELASPLEIWLEDEGLHAITALLPPEAGVPKAPKGLTNSQMAKLRRSVALVAGTGLRPRGSYPALDIIFG